MGFSDSVLTAAAAVLMLLLSVVRLLVNMNLSLETGLGD